MMDQRESSTARVSPFIDGVRLTAMAVLLLACADDARAQRRPPPVFDTRPMAELSLTITAAEFVNIDPAVRTELETLVLPTLASRLESKYTFVRWTWRHSYATPSSYYQLALRMRDEKKLGVVLDFEAAVKPKASMAAIDLKGTPERIYRETDYKPVYSAKLLASAINERLDLFFKSEPFITAVHSAYLLEVPVAADVLPTSTGIIVPNVIFDDLNAKASSTLHVQFSAWPAKTVKAPKDGTVNVTPLSKAQKEQRGIEGQIDAAYYDRKQLKMPPGTCSERLRALLGAPLRQSVVVVMGVYKKKSPLDVDANGLSTTRN